MTGGSNFKILLLTATITASFAITALIMITNIYSNKKSYNDQINYLIFSGAKKFTDIDVKSNYDFSHNNLPSNNGTYSVDCSGFVSLVLNHQNITNPIQEVINFIPKNFIPDIINNTPSPLHYSFFLKNKPHKQYWDLIDNAYSLIPGDFIIYTKHSMEYQNVGQNNYNKQFNTEYGQHIMIVAGRSQKTAADPHILWVPIFDSTKIPHGQTDQRSKHNTNGIGEGTIGLVINEYNHPIKIIWKDQSKNHTWKPITKDFLKRDIKMARITNR